MNNSEKLYGSFGSYELDIAAARIRAAKAAVRGNYATWITADHPYKTKAWDKWQQSEQDFEEALTVLAGACK